MTTTSSTGVSASLTGPVDYTQVRRLRRTGWLQRGRWIIAPITKGSGSEMARYAEDGWTRVADTETPMSEQVKGLAAAVETDLLWIVEKLQAGTIGTYAALQNLQDVVDYLQRETNLIAEAVAS